ncbi:cell division cycle 25 homolog d isoform X1 [Heterodontus francisci]|uniref:cell division cycle 25 homolog d isoform X1 n=1 Tax=Heterodontus francisci TaxID=7792 RepID=UPI00355B0485
MAFSPDPPFYPDLPFSPVSSLSFNLNSLSCQESDTPKRRLKLSPESGNPSPEALPVATETETPAGHSPSLPCRLETKRRSKSQTPARHTVPRPIRLLDKMKMKAEGNLPELDKEYESGHVQSGAVDSSPLNQFSGKHPEQADRHQTPAQKKRKSSFHENWETERRRVYNLRRLSCFQEIDVKQIPDSEEKGLIGDFSKACILPVEEGKHQDLTYISARTVAALLDGEFERLIDEYVIVDCRYPYEYNGGHIKGALNLYTEEQLINTFFPRHASPCLGKKCRVIIFHCEFSSERGPKFCRNLRRMDRNANVYPRLCFPELYILKDGYREFFQEFETFCEPQGYIQMHHKDYREELRTIRRKAHSVTRYRRRKELFKVANGR